MFVLSLKQITSVLWASIRSISGTLLPLTRVLTIDQYVFDEVVGFVKFISKTFIVTVFFLFFLSRIVCRFSQSEFALPSLRYFLNILFFCFIRRLMWSFNQGGSFSWQVTWNAETVAQWKCRENRGGVTQIVLKYRFKSRTILNKLKVKLI